MKVAIVLINGVDGTQASGNNGDGCVKRPHLVSTRDIGWFSNALFMVSAWIVHFIYSASTSVIPDKHKRKANEIMESIIDEETEKTIDADGDVIPELHLEVSKAVKVVMTVIDSVIFVAATAIVALATYAAFVYL